MHTDLIEVTGLDAETLARRLVADHRSEESPRPRWLAKRPHLVYERVGAATAAVSA